MSEPLLEVTDLVRHYSRPRKRMFSKKPVVEALNGVSFEVQPGESFGIVGESGSGKSTLARAIMALETPTSGSVHFKGENLFELSDDQRRTARRHLQMVFQDPFGSLDPKHTVRMIVTEPLHLVDDVDAETREAEAAEALTAVGLQPSDLDKYPHEFSGGQRQRIAIARALITKPDLIVADEPVSALDVSVQAQVLNLMMDLQQRYNLTYIIISHDLSVVRHVTDRLAVMQAGLIVEQGETNTVFDRPGHSYTKALLDSVLGLPEDEESEPAPKPDDTAMEAGDTEPDSPGDETAAASEEDDKAADDKADDREAGDNGEPIREAPLPIEATPAPRVVNGSAGASTAGVDRKPAIPVDMPPRVDAAAAIRAADAAITSAVASARSRSGSPPASLPVSQETANDPAAETSAAAPVAPADARVSEIPPPLPAAAPIVTGTPSNDHRPPDVTSEEPGGSSGDDMIHGQNLIDGQMSDASEDRLLKATNPSDGTIFGYIARSTSVDVERAVQSAHRAMTGSWGRMSAVERGRILSKLSDLVLANADDLARLEAKDVGKPLRQAKADAKALARYFEFYGGAADKVHGQTIPYEDGYTVLTLREPHGVTGHIVPWNYPMQIIGRSIGAALTMGNACVLKPGEDASMTALEVGRLALEAGLPPGVLNIVTGLGEEAGAALSAHRGIDHLSFTGSVATGRKVQEAAAAHSCPVTLELGGKSPQIVFADADLEQAIPVLVNAAIQNAGQTCSAGSRVLIQDRIYNELTKQLAERFDSLMVGPAEQDPDCGPLINATQKLRVEGYLERARADGIHVLAEGSFAPDTPDRGCYVKPTLLGPVLPDHALAQEEVFGPVLSAIRFTTEDDAIRIANDTPYGLVAGIWTQDGARQMRLARAIRSGQVFINNYGAGGGVELPFGGVKNSGFGREKGFEALYGFSTVKTVAIRHG